MANLTQKLVLMMEVEGQANVKRETERLAKDAAKAAAAATKQAERDAIASERRIALEKAKILRDSVRESNKRKFPSERVTGTGQVYAPDSGRATALVRQPIGGALLAGSGIGSSIVQNILYGGGGRGGD